MQAQNIAGSLCVVQRGMHVPPAPRQYVAPFPLALPGSH
jgi:hypothetical protein